jgi:uncharacterized protein (TIGR04141 family)
MVTLYRLTGATTMEEYLLAAGSDAETTDRHFERAGFQCFIRYGYLASAQPVWQNHVEALFGEPIGLPSVDPFAVLLIDRHPWVYALTWGAGYALLNDEFVEQGFGLSFAIARFDEFRLGSVTSRALDTSSRIAQVSFPRGAYFGNFGVRRHGELVSRVRGNADLSDLECARESNRTNRTITASDQLKIPLAYEFAGLVRDIDVIAEVADRAAPENSLRAIAQVRPLRQGHRLIAELERRLAEAIGGADTGQLDLGWPISDTDYGEALSFRIRSLGAGGPMHLPAPLILDNLADRLRPLPVADRVAALRKGHIQAYTDEEGTEQLGGGTSARKWIAFEAVIDDNRYVLRGGNWIRIGEAYVQQIRDEVAHLLERKANIEFPTWTPTGLSDDENRYCHTVERELDLLCLDRKFAQTPRHNNIELCDLLGPEDELIHVKWLGGAPAFSHLISQAQASISALQNEPAALRWLRDEVAERTHGARVLTQAPQTVVLAGAGRQWNTNDLFAMSQISLLSFFHGLPRNVDLQFADIPYVPKRRSRTKPAGPAHRR